MRWTLKTVSENLSFDVILQKLWEEINFLHAWNANLMTKLCVFIIFWLSYCILMSSSTRVNIRAVSEKNSTESALFNAEKLMFRAKIISSEQIDFSLVQHCWALISSESFSSEKDCCRENQSSLAPKQRWFTLVRGLPGSKSTELKDWQTENSTSGWGSFWERSPVGSWFSTYVFCDPRCPGTVPESFGTCGFSPQ